MDSSELQRVRYLNAYPLEYYFYFDLSETNECFCACRDANIMNGKTRMRACVIQVQADQEIDIKHPKKPSSRLSGNAAVVLCQAIGCCGITDPHIFHSSSPDVFKSCTSTSAVEAFVKARQGHLFPLQRGICFLESVRSTYTILVLASLMRLMLHCIPCSQQYLYMWIKFGLWTLPEPEGHHQHLIFRYI